MLICHVILDNISHQCSIPSENGNNEVQSTTSTDVEVIDSLPETTMLAQVAQRCSAKYVELLFNILLTHYTKLQFYLSY